MGRLRRRPLGVWGEYTLGGDPLEELVVERGLAHFLPLNKITGGPTWGVWGELGGDPWGVWGEGGDPWAEYTLGGDPATSSSALPLVLLHTSSTDWGGPLLSEVSEDIIMTPWLLGVSSGPHPCTPESVAPLDRGGGTPSLNWGGVTDQGHSR